MNKYRSHWISPYKILEKVLFWEDEDEIYGLRKHPKNAEGMYVSSDVFKDLVSEPRRYSKPYIAFLLKALDPVCTLLMKVLDKVHPKIDYVKIDKWDTWGMDHTLAQIILPMLKQLKETKHGVPGDFVWDEEKQCEKPFKQAEKAWNKVLDQMIWSFEQILDEENDEQFHTGGKFNVKAHQKHQKKIQDGLTLFGKYYRNLWD